MKIRESITKIYFISFISLMLFTTSHLKFMTLYLRKILYEGWNFNSGNYLFTTDTK